VFGMVVMQGWRLLTGEEHWVAVGASWRRLPLNGMLMLYVKSGKYIFIGVEVIQYSERRTQQCMFIARSIPNIESSITEEIASEDTAD